MQLIQVVLLGLYLPMSVMGQSVVPILDLTKPQACKDPVAAVLGRGGGYSWAGQPPPPQLPLTMRLVEVSPIPLRWYERVTYEIELENAGTTPIAIPWATICDVSAEGASNSSNLVSAGIFLHVVGDPVLQTIAFATAFGLRSDAVTMRTIALRERVRIRVAAQARGTVSNDFVLKELEGRSKAVLNFVAEFRIMLGSERDHLPLRSVNAVAVEILRWQDPK